MKEVTFGRGLTDQELAGFSGARDVIIIVLPDGRVVIIWL